MSYILQGDKIQATCKHAYLISLGSEFVVGKWKNISVFSVTDAKGHFRTTKHAKKITFIKPTKITDCDYSNGDMFLSLMDFETVLSGKENSSFLIGKIYRLYINVFICEWFLYVNGIFLFYLFIFVLLDVIGQVLDVGELETIQSQNGKMLKKIEFTLRDIK